MIPRCSLQPQLLCAGVQTLGVPGGLCPVPELLLAWPGVSGLSFLGAGWLQGDTEPAGDTARLSEGCRRVVRAQRHMESRQCPAPTGRARLSCCSCVSAAAA